MDEMMAQGAAPEEEAMEPMDALMDLIAQLQEKYQMEQEDVDVLVEAIYSLAEPEMPEGGEMPEEAAPDEQPMPEA